MSSLHHTRGEPRKHQTVHELKSLFSFIPCLVQLGELVIIDEVIKDETFVGCIGILECKRPLCLCFDYHIATGPSTMDTRMVINHICFTIIDEPDLVDNKSYYRLIYSQRANFKEVVPFNEERVVLWIHQVFRLQFVKDIALIRYLEEGPKSVLETTIHHRNVKIVQNLLSDRKFLTELFDLIKDTSASLDRRQDVVHFMHQFCSMAKKTGRNFYYRYGSSVTTSAKVESSKDIGNDD